MAGNFLVFGLYLKRHILDNLPGWGEEQWLTSTGTKFCTAAIAATTSGQSESASAFAVPPAEESPIVRRNNVERNPRHRQLHRQLSLPPRRLSRHRKRHLLDPLPSHRLRRLLDPLPRHPLSHLPGPRLRHRRRHLKKNHPQRQTDREHHTQLPKLAECFSMRKNSTVERLLQRRPDESCVPKSSRNRAAVRHVVRF